MPWCVFWVPSGPGGSCVVSQLAVSYLACFLTYLTGTCASPAVFVLDSLINVLSGSDSLLGLENPQGLFLRIND